MANELLRCEICGEVATRYHPQAVIPICQNVVCFVARLSLIEEMLKGFNKGNDNE